VSTFPILIPDDQFVGQKCRVAICGEKCKNCGKFDYEMPNNLNGCCSRVCMLQAEYAAQLAPAREEAA
jgi:hypothetical protein